MDKTIRIIGLLSLITILLALPTGQASAALRACRTDPIFRLSNGDILSITLNISTDPADVRSAVYILHVPAGVTVTQVIYTGGAFASKETYKVYQDSPLKTYTTDTVVTTINTGRIAVIATTRLNGVVAKSASGYNRDHLIVTLVKP